MGTNSMTWILNHPELLALTLNLTMSLIFFLKHDWPKTVYWIGATTLVCGLLMMKGAR